MYEPPGGRFLWSTETAVCGMPTGLYLYCGTPQHEYDFKGFPDDIAGPRSHSRRGILS